MNKQYIFFLLFSLILWSCSSTKDRKFRDQVSTELVEAFDLKDDRFEKFKVHDVSENDEEVSQIKKDIDEKKPLKEISKKVEKKKVVPKKKIVKKKIEVKEKVSKEETPEDIPVEKTKDYPKKFKEYNKKYKYVWDNVKPVFFPNEKFVLRASYLGITVGHAKLETLPVVNVAGRKAFHFKGSLKSASFYDYIYEVEDWIESYVDARTFLPVKYTLVQRESGQDVDDLQLFDPETLKTYFWYKRLKKGKIKKIEKNEYTPKYFQDSFSALYFVRGLDLKIGNKFEFPIITRTKIWLMKMEVEKIEEIKIMGKWINAYKIKAETRFPGVLSKRGDINFWFSTDKFRKILKFKANVKIGAIEGELVEYTQGDKRVTMSDIFPGEY
ncbi:DUF3108 domain-containing protein [Halobacteriovorax sp. JY17]|uniref:DUF3108 domain-containing protein n=1 Tax=Halobacteriovorax sp. JY17 TaxID=2014617 RepID=UPI000C39B0D9|nr:DUF3108 domain-containing protein [Halobacteriovorax sp. JY17]PIK14931.1 MAG: hypothetical protein CES88_11400 [Halobacteriovorax sp. JY17]